MTRCGIFYRKVKELGDFDEIKEFCGKTDNTVYKIIAHIRYMDEFFPGWDSESCTFVQLTESKTRLLRALANFDSKRHEEVLSHVRKLQRSPTVDEIQDMIDSRPAFDRFGEPLRCTGHIDTCRNWKCKAMVLGEGDA